MDSFNQQQLLFFKRLLLERLEVLQSQNSETEVVELDQTRQGRLSRMDAMLGQAMQKQLSSRTKQQIDQIQEALHKIDQQTYGHCESCGELISQQRLQAMPQVNCCVSCAQ